MTTTLTPPADAPDLDNLTARREADALDRWRTEGKAPSGICPHCGSTVSVVQRDERYVARCSHRGCGARGPQHSRLTSAVEAFCRPPAYVLRHMDVNPSSLINIDKAVNLAREIVQADESCWLDSVSANDAVELARAVLAMHEIIDIAGRQVLDAIRTLDAEARRE